MIPVIMPLNKLAITTPNDTRNDTPNDTRTIPVIIFLMISEIIPITIPVVMHLMIPAILPRTIL